MFTFEMSELFPSPSPFPKWSIYTDQNVMQKFFVFVFFLFFQKQGVPCFCWIAAIRCRAQPCHIHKKFSKQWKNIRSVINNIQNTFGVGYFDTMCDYEFWEFWKYHIDTAAYGRNSTKTGSTLFLPKHRHKNF